MDKKRGSLSGDSLRKCLPMVHFSQIPIVEATVRVRKLNQLSALILGHEASQPAATPQACRPGGHSPGPARPGCSRTPPGPQEGAGTGADRPNAATEKSTFYKRNNSCNRTMDSKSTRDFQSIGVSQGGGFSNILAARIYLACLVGK